MNGILKRPTAAMSVRHLAAALMILLVAACAAQPPVPEDRYYRLQAVASSSPLASPVLAGTLEIARFSADGLTAGRPIVYVRADDPNQLLEYHYHFWIQPPTVMLRDELVAALRQANVAETVVTPDMRLVPDHVMSGRIRKLEQVLGDPDRSVIEIEVAVRRQDDNALVFLKTYRHETPQRGAGVAAAVDAMNEAFNIVVSDLLSDLSAL